MGFNYVGDNVCIGEKALSFESPAIANFILDLADAAGRDVTPMKLQKLLYFAHGYHLALTGDPLLDEEVEAWQWGPVIPGIYRQFKHLGSNPIKGERARRETGFDRSVASLEKYGETATFAKALVEKVWDEFKRFSGVQLSNMSHETDTPWYQVWNEMGPDKRKNKDIPEDKIASWFTARLATAK